MRSGIAAEMILQREAGVCCVLVLCLSHSCDNSDVSSDTGFHHGGKVMGRGQRGESFCSLVLRMLFQGLFTDGFSLRMMEYSSEVLQGTWINECTIA